MSKRRDVLLGACSIPIAGIAGLGSTQKNVPRDEALREAREGRDRELLAEAADDLAAGRHVRARLLLNTLLNVYGDGSFAPLARILLFYSLATSYPNLHGGDDVLKRVEAYLEEVKAATKGSGAGGAV
jgi:hypothetical protein